MKRNIVLLFILCSKLGVWAQEASTQDASISTATYGNVIGKTRTMTLSFSHGITDYCAFQADIALPENTEVTGITAKAPLINGGKTTINSTQYNTDFIVKYKQESNTCHIIGYNYANTAIGGTSGDIILTLTLKTTDEIAYDANTVKVENVTFISKTTDGLNSVPLPAVNASTSKLWGDVVVDQTVDANDIQATTNLYGGNTSPDYDSFAADVNQDGVYDANDIQSVTNIYGGSNN